MESDNYLAALKWWRSMSMAQQYEVWYPWVLTATEKPVAMKNLHLYEFHLIDLWDKVMRYEEDGLQVEAVVEEESSS